MRSRNNWRKIIHDSRPTIRTCVIINLCKPKSLSMTSNGQHFIVLELINPLFHKKSALESSGRKYIFENVTFTISDLVFVKCMRKMDRCKFKIISSTKFKDFLLLSQWWSKLRNHKILTLLFFGPAFWGLNMGLLYWPPVWKGFDLSSSVLFAWKCMNLITSWWFQVSVCSKAELPLEGIFSHSIFFPGNFY